MHAVMIILVVFLSLISLPSCQSQQATNCSDVYPPGATHIIVALFDITAWNPTSNERGIQLDQVYQSKHMVTLTNLLRNYHDPADSNVYGTVVCDTFNLVDTAVNTAVEMINNLSSKTILGIVGPTSASSALAVARAASVKQIPVISHAPFIPPAATPPLSNLFRTLPSSDSLLTKLYDAVQQLQWTYFALVVSDVAPYPDIGQQLQQKLAPLGYRICLSTGSVMKVSPHAVDQELDVVLTTLSAKASATVLGVVFLGDKPLFNRFLAAQSRNANPLQWLFAGPSTDTIPTSAKVSSLEFSSPVADFLSSIDRTVSTDQLTSLFPWFRRPVPYDATKSSFFFRHLAVAVVDLVNAYRACAKPATAGCALNTLHTRNSQLPSFKLPDPYASFNDNNTLTSLDAIQLTPATASPSSCLKQCDECLDSITNSVLHIPGDYYIIGIFPVHDRDPNDLVKCGLFRKTSGYLLVEAFLYAMQIVNKTLEKTDMAKRAMAQFQNATFKLGAILIDDCYQPQRLATLLATVLTDDDAQKLYGWPQRDRVIGIVGAFSSDLSIAAASVAKVYHLPIISYASTAISLNDSSKYPSFLRTVPSDAFQVDAILQLLQKLDWKYVSVVNMANEYGRGGYRELALNGASKGICIGLQQEIDESTNVPTLISNLKSYSDARGVIFFGEYGALLNITKELGDSGEFYFITSEAVGKRNEMIQGATGRKMLGSITMQIQNGDEGILDDDLNVFVGKKDPKGSSNPWFLEFWEETFSCSLPERFTTNYVELCSAHTRSLEGKQWDEPFRVPVMNAVMSLVRGVIDMCPAKTTVGKLCDGLQSEDGVKTLISKIRNVMLSPSATGSNMRPFTAGGEGNTGYDLFNIQYIKTPDFYHIGTYKIETKSLTLEQSYKFYRDSQLSIPASDAKSVCLRGPCLAKCVSNSATSSNDWMIATIALIVIASVLLLVLIIGAIILAARRKAASKNKSGVSNSTFSGSLDPAAPPLPRDRGTALSHLYEEAVDPARISYITIRPQVEIGAPTRFASASSNSRNGIHYVDTNNPSSSSSSGGTTQAFNYPDDLQALRAHRGVVGERNWQQPEGASDRRSPSERSDRTSVVL